jgi:hypothetical protein
VLLVFAQQRDARVAIDAWNAHAVRFFATRIGLAEDRADASEPLGFVVAPDGAAPGIRSVVARARAPEDLARAQALDPGTGLALVARRCPTVWVVARESPSDALALRLAAILASVLLGPILDSEAGAQGELFGVKTARAKLDQ